MCRRWRSHSPNEMSSDGFLFTGITMGDLPGGGIVLSQTGCITFYIPFGIMGIRGRWLNDGSFRERRAAMNNLYLQERLVALKLQEVQREVEQARLLREAGLSNADLLARAA